MDQKSSGRSLAPSRIFQTQTVFDLSGNVLSSGPLASTTGKMIDPDIKPIYTDEILVGYATPLAGAYSLDVFFMSRGMHNFIEDVPSRLNGTAPDSGPFVAANLPCVAFAACQIGGRPAHLPRRHRRCPAPACQRLDERHQLHVEPVRRQFRSRLLDWSPVFNTSSFIQDGPGHERRGSEPLWSALRRSAARLQGVHLVRGDQPSDRCRATCACRAGRRGRRGAATGQARC